MLKVREERVHTIHAKTGLHVLRVGFGLFMIEVAGGKVALHGVPLPEGGKIRWRVGLAITNAATFDAATAASADEVLTEIARRMSGERWPWAGFAITNPN